MSNNKRKTTMGGLRLTLAAAATENLAPVVVVVDVVTRLGRIQQEIAAFGFRPPFAG